MTIVHLPPVVDDIPQRFAGSSDYVNLKRDVMLVKANVRGMNGAAQHEYHALKLAWRRKSMAERLRLFPDASPRDQSDPPEPGMPDGRAQREWAKHQVTIMPMEQIIGKFNKP